MYLPRLQCSETSAASCLLACHRCLQERSGRQRDLRRADRDDRRRSHQHQFAVARQPRQPVLFGDARKLRDHGRRQRAGAAHVDIEPAIGRGDLDVERLSHRDQRLGDRPGRLDRAVQMRDRGSGQRSIGTMSCELAAAKPTLSTSCVPIRACSVMRRRPSAMGIDQGRDLAIDPGLRQRRRPRVRASRRDRPRRPSAGSRSRRRRRNAGRTARSAPGLRSRP